MPSMLLSQLSECIVSMDSEIILGNCLEVLKKYDDNFFDLIYADPPYNLSGKDYLTVKNGKPVRCHKGAWDVIDNMHEFNSSWLSECKRVLSTSGTIWISGTLHLHPIIGVILKELDFWIINDIVWYKNNATPIMVQNRLVPSTELIWLASKTKKYYFDYEYAKTLNNGKQMKNLWQINAQRHKTKHPTEKPEVLLERIIKIGSQVGDRVLDPFMGSGTTCVVAHKLGREYYGIELSVDYYEIAKQRLSASQIEISSV